MGGALLMRQAAVVSGVVSAVLFGGVLLALSSDYVPQGPATSVQELGMKKVQIALPVAGQSIQNAQKTITALKAQLSELKLYVNKYGVRSLKTGSTSTAALLKQVDTLGKRLTTLEAAVGEETDKTHSTEYHIAEAKHVTKSELLESRASMLATTLHHVKVALPIGGESMKQATKTLLMLEKELADLKLFVVKYGVGILNNGTAVSDSSDSTFPPVTQSSVEEQIDTMTTAIATLKKLVATESEKTHSIEYHVAKSNSTR